MAIAFLGEKFNDEKLKGNPWTWEDESWIPPDEFDVANDFPDIKAWQKKLLPSVQSLCFRHKTAKESEANDMNNDNQYFDGYEAETYHSLDMEARGSHQRSQRLNEDSTYERLSEFRGREVTHQDKVVERAVVTPPLAFEALRNALPDTHISVFLSECVRNIEPKLVAAILSRYVYYRETKMYVDNKSSFYALLQILSSPTEEHHNRV